MHVLANSKEKCVYCVRSLTSWVNCMSIACMSSWGRSIATRKGIVDANDKKMLLITPETAGQLVFASSTSARWFRYRVTQKDAALRNFFAAFIVTYSLHFISISFHIFFWLSASRFLYFFLLLIFSPLLHVFYIFCKLHVIDYAYFSFIICRSFYFANKLLCMPYGF